MSKTVYLIIFLSVVLIKSETSFGQTLKKELGICGKTMGAILKVDPKAEPILKAAFMKDAEFCDNGRYEQGANYIIYLYNAKDQLVYDKHVYLSEHAIAEQANDKGEFEVEKTKILPSINSRIVKFPVSKEIGEVKSYKIESLGEKKVFGIKKIKW
jgi:hypothetical protein